MGTILDINVYELVCFLTSPSWWGPGAPATHPHEKSWQVTPPPPVSVSYLRIYRN